jgi:predicted glutamine amidotransferase
MTLDELEREANARGARAVILNRNVWPRHGDGWGVTLVGERAGRPRVATKIAPTLDAAAELALLAWDTDNPSDPVRIS